MALLLICSLVYAQDPGPEYLCTHNDAIGFVLKEEKWTPGILTFRDNHDLIIRKNDDFQWAMVIANNDAAAPCVGNFDEEGFFSCSLEGVEFHFNKKSLRFQVYLRDGYVMGDDEFIRNNPALHPSLAIGTCTSSKKE